MLVAVVHDEDAVNVNLDVVAFCLGLKEVEKDSPRYVQYEGNSNKHFTMKCFGAR